ncbi:response regulator [Mycobacterium kansasii]|uniref:Response regulator n=1 Tax=Mycobacterium kansasii TaxID=1768 RepID=A0A1V3XS50_MYCKA|nr:response regulator [Mycobacterium kansasii]
MGIAKQLKDELSTCPPILVLTGRPDDSWLASWSRAEAAVSHPIDPIVLGRTALGLLRAPRSDRRVPQPNGPPGYRANPNSDQPRGTPTPPRPRICRCPRGLTPGMGPCRSATMLKVTAAVHKPGPSQQPGHRPAAVSAANTTDHGAT